MTIRTVDHWEIDEIMLLTADIDITNDSFDHELGHQRVKDFDLRNFTIFIMVNGSEVDVTKGFDTDANRRHYDRLKEKLLKVAIEQYSGAA